MHIEVPFIGGNMEDFETIPIIPSTGFSRDDLFSPLSSQTAVNALTETIRQYFPDAMLEAYGSSINGFGLQSSDVDLCLFLPDAPQSHQQSIRRRRAMEVRQSVSSMSHTFLESGCRSYSHDFSDQSRGRRI